jgi:hypothetical protein
MLAAGKSAAPAHHDRWSDSHHGLTLDVGTRRRLKCLVGDFVDDIFIRLAELGRSAVVHEESPFSLLLMLQ